MNHIFAIVLLLMLVPQNQNLPDEYHQLPELVTEKATIIVAGTYGQGRGPCIYLGDGRRAWALESWLNVKRVYRGKLGGKSIYLGSRVSPKINGVSVKLEVGRDYLVLLRPNDESMKSIKAGGYVPARNALRDEEIIAIVDCASASFRCYVAALVVPRFLSSHFYLNGKTQRRCCRRYRPSVLASGMWLTQHLQ